jgi:hypothetical protein
MGKIMEVTAPVQFEELSGQIPEATEKNHENINQCRRSLDRDLSPR